MAILKASITHGSWLTLIYISFRFDGLLSRLTSLFSLQALYLDLKNQDKLGILTPAPVKMQAPVLERYGA